jgi:hypothetical protein
MKQLLFLLIFSSLAIISCKSDKSTSESAKKEDIIVTAESPKKYTLTPFSPSKSFEDARLNGMTFKSGVFDFSVAEGEYVLGAQTDDANEKMCANSGKGQHIHLIIDNAPYAAKYTNKFDYDVADGEHHLLAFLSRSYHESIKTDAAHIANKITVKNNTIAESSPITDPMLFYSRPKGTYSGAGETEKVMLDFYPINVDIGTTHKIIALINGEEHEINKWQPYYITGLPLGENEVKLSLVDIDGNKLTAPYNPVSRTFTLRGDTAQ